MSLMPTSQFPGPATYPITPSAKQTGNLPSMPMDRFSPTPFDETFRANNFRPVVSNPIYSSLNFSSDTSSVSSPISPAFSSYPNTPPDSLSLYSCTSRKNGSFTGRPSGLSSLPVSGVNPQARTRKDKKGPSSIDVVTMLSGLCFLVSGAVSIISCVVRKRPCKPEEYLAHFANGMGGVFGVIAGLVMWKSNRSQNHQNANQRQVGDNGDHNV